MTVSIFSSSEDERKANFTRLLAMYILIIRGKKIDR